MKILHVNTSSSGGGAGRAAYRLVCAQQKMGYQSELLTTQGVTNSSIVIRPESRLRRFRQRMHNKVSDQILRLQGTDNTVQHSLNLFSTGLDNYINDSGADVVNLHWLGYEMLSIRDIARICKPVCWTLHDMWAFCGSEHYVSKQNEVRYVDGYSSNNTPDGNRGIDIDKHIWNLKLRLWRNRQFHLISPSTWLARCAANSLLCKSQQISVIPNTLCLDTFRPLNRNVCRGKFEFPENVKIILFGAMGGDKDARKGYHLLHSALQKLSEKDHGQDYLCVVFGSSTPSGESVIPFETTWLGHLSDDKSLSQLYNCADVMVVPSVVDNLPQTATEAQSCGCPVVAFNCGGISDIVKHKFNGYLANAYDTGDLADGIIWATTKQGPETDSNQSVRLRAREFALKNWESELVVGKYINVYEKVIRLNSSK